MKALLKETTLTDGSTVMDLNLFPNSNGLLGEKKCIFSFNSERDSTEFIVEFRKLIEKHTCETFDLEEHLTSTEL